MAVGDALDEVPPQLMDLLDNVVFLVEDEPPDDDPDLLGVYDGVPLTERDDLFGRFLAAAGNGDVDGLIQLLAADVVAYGDGGGKVPQWSNPIEGADKVARMFAGLGAQIARLGASAEPHRINGQPGIVFRGPHGGIFSVMSFEVVGGRVATIRSIVNPDKLRNVGEVGSLRDPRARPERARHTAVSHPE